MGGTLLNLHNADEIVNELSPVPSKRVIGELNRIITQEPLTRIEDVPFLAAVLRGLLMIKEDQERHSFWD
jgi:hypothetical protein